MNNKKEQSTFSKVTKIVIWAMIIVTVGSVLLTTILSVMN